MLAANVPQSNLVFRRLGFIFFMEQNQLYAYMPVPNNIILGASNIQQAVLRFHPRRHERM